MEKKAMTKAMSPKDIGKYKANAFPVWVFEAFNQCIASSFTNGRAMVKQNDVINKMICLQHDTLDEDAIEDGQGLSRAEIFDNGYLNIEEVYREQGWKVEYDKPGYSESYDAFWIFKE
jgi:hypothetical protein